MNSHIFNWKKLLTLGLEEDAFTFDWTARATQQAGKASHSLCKATLIAKTGGIWAAETGLGALRLLSQELGLPLTIHSKQKDGNLLNPGTAICEWSGEAGAILAFERTYINLAAYACGIATHTFHFTEKVKKAQMKKPPRIVPTRKILPGYRDLAIQSTLLGGAHPHRFNLSGGLLLKENHIAAAGGISAAIRAARESAPHLLKIEIEVRSLKELSLAIEEKVEVIMLDNFSLAEIKEAISLKPKEGTLFEVSGGITLEQLENYLIEGIDVISVGSLTHSVKALDLSLLMNTIIS